MNYGKADGDIVVLYRAMALLLQLECHLAITLFSGSIAVTAP
jgi:hypothetical protein